MRKAKPLVSLVELGYMERTLKLLPNLNANSVLPTPIHPPLVLMQKANAIVALRGGHQAKSDKVLSPLVLNLLLVDLGKQAVSLMTAKPEHIKMNLGRPLASFVKLGNMELLQKLQPYLNA